MTDIKTVLELIGLILQNVYWIIVIILLCSKSSTIQDKKKNSSPPASTDEFSEFHGGAVMRIPPDRQDRDREGKFRWGVGMCSCRDQV